jgi:hypothetical protein
MFTNPKQKHKKDTTRASRLKITHVECLRVSRLANIQDFDNIFVVHAAQEGYFTENTLAVLEIIKKMIYALDSDQLV